MAYKRRSTSIIDVTGMSINDIMDIDIETFNVLGERELRAITSRLVSASNKRVRALQQRDINSPALRSLGTDTAFSTQLPQDINPKQRVNKLRSEFARARNFLQMKTSTIKGYKRYAKQLRTGLEEEMGRNLTDAEINTAFRILHKLQQSGRVPGKKTQGSQHAKEQIFQIISDLDNFDSVELEEDGTSFDDYIMKETMNEYTEFYEEKPDKQFQRIPNKK